MTVAQPRLTEATPLLEGTVTTSRMAAGNQILNSLPNADRSAILEISHGFELEAGETLCESGRRPHCMEFVESGVVSAVVVMQNGQTVESYMIGREGVTHPTMRFEDPCYARLVAQISGRGRRVNARRMKALAADRPAISSALAVYAQRLLGELEQSTGCNALHRTEERFAKWILRCHDRVDGDSLNLTQEFLAAMLGAQRTTVNEAAQRLQMDGAIRYSRGVIRVLDRTLVEQAACECYRARRHSLDDLMRDCG